MKTLILVSTLGLVVQNPLHIKDNTAINMVTMNVKFNQQAAIERLVKILMDGFSNQDADAFASVFTHDADCIIRDGQHLKGQQEIREMHKRIFSSIYREGTVSTYQIESIRFLNETVSIARIKGHMEFSSGSDRAEVNGRISLVCTKQDADWKVTLFQNTSEMKPVSR